MITCRYVTNSKVDISFVSLPCHVFFILEEKLQREPETLWNCHSLVVGSYRKYFFGKTFSFNHILEKQEQYELRSCCAKPQTMKYAQVGL